MAGLVRDLNRWAAARWRININVNEENGLLLADISALKARGVNVDSLTKALIDTVSKLKGIRFNRHPKSLGAQGE